MEDDVVIAVHNISKNFVLPHERVHTIKSLFTGVFKRRRKSKETQHALKNVSFEIKRGEFFGIVGRNGSGKSTLLKMLAGIYQPSKGSIQIRGKLVPFIELGVGFNPELTGRENVYLNGALLGFSEKEINKMYDEIVEFAELERFMDQKLKNYSSGMQVRLAFSMAIRADADILLIDEVLAVGDADFQRKCFNYFRQLKRDKKTVVFVSHDMDAIREYCDKAILIDNSQVLARGSAGKIASDYNHLFLEELNLITANPGEKGQAPKQQRWGSGDAQFTLANASPHKLTGDDPLIRITTTLKTKKDMEEVVVGFSVKNNADALILGTNTRLMSQQLTNIKKDDSINIEWFVPNIFNDGEYYINIVAEDTASRALDWWEDAISFSVLKESGTGYIVYPEIDLKVER